MSSLDCILITGATSGLGRALALHYAVPGRTLLLTGRNELRLKEIALSCEEKGAKIVGLPMDVTDAHALRSWLLGEWQKQPIDLVIANAGISAGTGFGGEDEAQARQIFATNVNGVLNTILPLLPMMKQRGNGQIAIISSLAGLRGMPSAPAYSASKAAVRAYGEGLRGELKPHGVKVNVVCPGFIKTPMTDVNPYPMPFLMSAAKAAGIIAAGLEKNKARIAFPLPMYLGLWLLSLLPLALTDRLFSMLPGKPAANENNTLFPRRRE